MSNMKIVSIVDHEVTRMRALVMTDLANIVTNLAQELMLIDQRIKAVQREIERLDARTKPEGVPSPSASEN
jgi:hypothetical protein